MTPTGIGVIDRYRLFLSEVLSDREEFKSMDNSASGRSYLPGKPGIRAAGQIWGEWRWADASDHSHADYSSQSGGHRCPSAGRSALDQWVHFAAPAGNNFRYTATRDDAASRDV